MIHRQKFRQQMLQQKDRNYGHLVAFWTGEKVSITFGLLQEKFLNMSMNRRSGISDYCRRETIVRVLESLLSKILISFDNSRWIYSALVFLDSCKIRPDTAPKMKFSI